MFTKTKMLIIITTIVPLTAMSQSLPDSTPNLQEYVITISGRTNPDQLSRGKAISRLARTTDWINGRLSESDAAVLQAEAGYVDIFQSNIINLQQQQFEQLGRTYIEGQALESIDAIAVANELHRIDEEVDAEFDRHYLPLLDRLSNDGRRVVTEEAIPAALRATRKQYLDYKSLAKDHPKYLQELIYNSWSEISDRGGFVGITRTEEETEISTDGIITRTTNKIIE